ncbi:MAG: hypothetical protein ACJA01_004290 [Saprospiraceae bacterium]|jgi:hypothetical protein
MIFLLSLISLFILSPDGAMIAVDADHIGKWQYTVESPDITYKGVLEFSGEEGAYIGTLKSDGNSINLTDITFEGSKLQFKMNVQGYLCAVNAKIAKDDLSGAVSVEGMELPLSGTRM